MSKQDKQVVKGDNQREKQNENYKDYVELLRDPTFDFYGIFAYFKLNFIRDNAVCDILSSSGDSVSSMAAVDCYKEQEHTYNPLITFSAAQQPKSFTKENIIEYSEEEVATKVSLCCAFTLAHGSKSFKQCYFYMLAVRCLLHQPPDVETCDKIMSIAKRIYPWVAFEAYRVKGKSVQPILLLFNFLEYDVQEMLKGECVNRLPFAKLEKVTYGYNNSELMVTLDNELLLYRAKYAFQRTFIAEIFRYAIAHDLSIKVRTHYINPNDTNYAEQYQKQTNQDNKLAQEGFFKLIENDRIIPPKAILTYRGRIVSENEKVVNSKSDFTYISLGINQIVVHNNLTTMKFHQIIPFNNDGFYLEITADSKCLGFHIGSSRNFAYFQTTLEVQNFREAVQVVRHQKIYLDSYFLHFPNDQSQQHLLRFKRYKLKEVSRQCEETRKTLDYQQGIKDWLDLQVIQQEVNASTPQQKKLLSSQVRSVTPNVRTQDHTKYRGLEPPNSPNFAKKIDLSRTRDTRPHEQHDHYNMKTQNSSNQFL